MRGDHACATYELFAKKCRELAARMIKADDKEVLELKVAAWDELARNVIGKVKNAN